MATEQKIHGELTQIDENGTVTVMYPHTTVDDITGVLPVEKGGTGCNSTSDLLFNLSFKSPIDYLNSIEDEYIDLNNLTAAEHCGYWYFGVNYRPNNSPDPENTGYLFVVRGGGATGTVRKQIWMNQSGEQSTYIRTYTGTEWTPWVKLAIESNKLLTNQDLNNVKIDGVYYAKGNNSVSNKPNGVPTSFGLTVIRTANNYYVQLYYTPNNMVYRRWYDGTNDTWSEWVKDDNVNTTYNVMTGATSSYDGSSGLVPAPTTNDINSYLRGDGTWNNPTDAKLLTNEDLNDVKTNGIYYAKGNNTVSNRPNISTKAFGLEVICTSVNYYVQLYYTPSNSVYRRWYDGTNDRWSEWVKDKYTDTTYSNMGGASSSYDGSSGLVPAPTTNDINSYLRGDGTWNNPTDAKLLTNEDLNDVKTNGIYYAKGNNTVSNRPNISTKAFGLEVICTSVNYYVQLYYTPSNLVYRRWYDGTNDIWSEWVQDKLTDNNTWIKVSTTSDGYINKLSGNTTEWLSGDGTWSTPTASDIGALPSSTTYALSSTSGGAAISANRLTNPVNINGVSFDGSCDISINDRRVAIVGNDSSSDNSIGWYKVADGTLTGYTNTSLLFAVTGLFAVDDLEEYYTFTIDDPESYYMSGILQLDIRSMHGILTVNNFGWLTRTNNLPLNSFKVKITNDKWTLYYNVKQLYCRVFFEVIEESGTNTVNASYTLYSNQTKETAIPIEAVTSVDLYIPISSSTTIGDRSVSIAGSTNDILSKDSGILGGSSNTINGSSYSKYSCIIGGNTNTIDPENNDNSEGDVIIGGAHNETSGYYNITSGYYNTNSGMSTFVCGKYNDSATPSSGVNSNDGDAFVIGNGTSTTDRSNVFRVEYNGTIYAGNSTIQSGADYAEFIKPWADGNPDNEDRVGYMVTIKDGYLYKANDGDYIIGITSGNPSVVGNGDENYYWKYERDEFNRIIYEDVEELIETTDNDGNVVFIKSGNIIKNARPKISENYDSSLQDSYIERSKRPEWDYVGMRGIVSVRDDGTCITGGFCKCGTDGIATKSDTQGFNTYYVIERINDHVISVEVK